MITWGHSKDHRPDLKQLVWVLTVAADGSVPLAHRLADGNTSDDPTHVPTWDGLVARVGRSDFLYVADSKLCSRAALGHIAGRGGRFVTRAAPFPRRGRRLPRLAPDPHPDLDRGRAPARCPRRRAWAFGRLRLDGTRPIRRAVGASVNDVVLAATAGALRRWLVRHGALPAEPLRAMVPVSVRTSEELVTYGNRIGLMLCPLPMNEADPVERLRSVRESTKVARENHAIDAERLQDITRFAVPALTTRAAGIAARIRLADWLRLPMNLVVSNVPGTRAPLRLAGWNLLELYPVPPISDGLGLNVTVQGYRDHLHLGMTASPELVPDLWQLARYLEQAHEELEHATTR